MTFRMSPRFRTHVCLGVIVLLLPLLPAVALGQYMFLDTNGDEVSPEAVSLLINPSACEKTSSGRDHGLETWTPSGGGVLFFE